MLFLSCIAHSDTELNFKNWVDQWTDTLISHIKTFYWIYTTVVAVKNTIMLHKTYKNNLAKYVKSHNSVIYQCILIKFCMLHTHVTYYTFCSLVCIKLLIVMEWSNLFTWLAAILVLAAILNLRTWKPSATEAYI